MKSAKFCRYFMGNAVKNNGTNSSLCLKYEYFVLTVAVGWSPARASFVSAVQFYNLAARRCITDATRKKQINCLPRI